MTPIKNDTVPTACWVVGSKVAEMTPIKNGSLSEETGKEGSKVAEMTPIKNLEALVSRRYAGSWNDTHQKQYSRVQSILTR